VASETAFFQVPEAKRGRGAHFASVVLPQMIPTAIALEWLFTGRRVSVAEAERGTGESRCAPEKLMEVALQLANDVISSAPLSLQKMKVTARKNGRHAVARRFAHGRRPNPYSSEDQIEARARSSTSVHPVLDGTLTLGGVASLRPLFEPEHVAVIGASRNTTKHGHRAVTSLLAHGFQGRISLIQSVGRRGAGMPCLPSIADAPGRVDCAIVIIPPRVPWRRSVSVPPPACARWSSQSSASPNSVRTKGALVKTRSPPSRAPTAFGCSGPIPTAFSTPRTISPMGSNTSHSEPMESGSISVVSHSGALFNHFARPPSTIRVRAFLSLCRWARGRRRHAATCSSISSKTRRPA